MLSYNETYRLNSDYNTLAVKLHNQDLDPWTELPKYAQVIFNGWEDNERKMIAAVKCEDFYAK